MRVKGRLWLSLLCMVLLSGCMPTSDERVFQKIHQKLTSLESYSCIAQVYVKGNKEPGEFKVKQWFSVPGKYRIEVIDPGDMENKTTVSDGERIWMYYPYIDQIFLMENAAEAEEEHLFVGFFLRDLLESEEIKFCTVNREGEEMLAVELPVPGGNKYCYMQKLFFDRRDIVPVLLEIYDINGNVTTRVRYSEFVYNCNPDPDLFRKVNVTECMLYEEKDIARLFPVSLEEARQVLDFSPLRLVSIPDGFEQEYVQVVDSDSGKALLINYKGRDGSFAILQRLVSGEKGNYYYQGEIIELGDREAVYSEDRHTRKICWSEGNMEIRVLGTVSRKTLLEIAAHIR